jgi:hypothetical protein
MGRKRIAGVADEARICEAARRDAFVKATRKGVTDDEAAYWMGLSREFENRRKRFEVRLVACGPWMTSIRSS